MKTIRYISLLISSCLLLVAVNSCNDDAFLEEHPKTIYGFENAFKSASQVNDCVTACYRGVRFAYFGEDPIWLGWVRTLWTAEMRVGKATSPIG